MLKKKLSRYNHVFATTNVRTNLYVITCSETQFPKSWNRFKHVIHGSTAEKIAQSHATMKRKAMKDRTQQLKQKNQSPPQGFSQLEKERGAGDEIAEEFGLHQRTNLRSFIFTWTGALAIGCFLSWSSSLEVFHSHIYRPKKYKDKRTSYERNDMWKTNTTLGRHLCK